jgi:hypothetical protein
MEVTVKLPSDQSEISLAQYQKWAAGVTEETPDDLYFRMRTVSIFTGYKLGHVAQLKKHDVDDMYNHIVNVLNTKQEPVFRFTILGQEYGFITNLDDITIGEYADLDEPMKKWETMHIAMSVLFRPITKALKDRYEIAPYTGSKDNQEVMKYMPLSVVNGANAFFLNLLKDLAHYTQKSTLVEMVEQIASEWNHNLTRSGAGIRQSTHSLVETLRDLVR